MKTPEDIAADAANEVHNWIRNADSKEYPENISRFAHELQTFTAIITRRIAPLVARIKELETSVLDEVENSARERAWTEQETKKTDSGALSSVAQDLRLLAENGRFRIISECGRMIVGYWPENDPQKKQESKP